MIRCELGGVDGGFSPAVLSVPVVASLFAVLLTKHGDWCSQTNTAVSSVHVPGDMTQCIDCVC